MLIKMHVCSYETYFVIGQEDQAPTRRTCLNQIAYFRVVYSFFDVPLELLLNLSYLPDVESSSGRLFLGRFNSRRKAPNVLYEPYAVHIFIFNFALDAITFKRYT